MKEEGFMNKALNKIKEKDIKARFILNQSAFNLPDNFVTVICNLSYFSVDMKYPRILFYNFIALVKFPLLVSKYFTHSSLDSQVLI